MVTHSLSHRVKLLCGAAATLAGRLTHCAELTTLFPVNAGFYSVVSVLILLDDPTDSSLVVFCFHSQYLEVKPQT